MNIKRYIYTTPEGYSLDGICANIGVNTMDARYMIHPTHGHRLILLNGLGFPYDFLGFADQSLDVKIYRYVYNFDGRAGTPPFEIEITESFFLGTEVARCALVRVCHGSSFECFPVFDDITESEANKLITRETFYLFSDRRLWSGTVQVSSAEVDQVKILYESILASPYVRYYPKPGGLFWDTQQMFLYSSGSRSAYIPLGFTGLIDLTTLRYSRSAGQSTISFRFYFSLKDNTPLLVI